MTDHRILFSWDMNTARALTPYTIPPSSPPKSQASAVPLIDHAPSMPHNDDGEEDYAEDYDEDYDDGEGDDWAAHVCERGGVGCVLRGRQARGWGEGKERTNALRRQRGLLYWSDKQNVM